MRYRPEIDGLRALAVVPVVFFHAGLGAFGGGFVGVDVFFVISGYLITTIILSEMEQGTFSLARFYERRARRILPVLFLVMLASLACAWVLLAPADMQAFSRSLVAVSTFSSNFLFFSEAGYWDTAGELKPMLHTWSLAVEEQYYVLFPLLLLLLWRYRRRWITASLAAIAAASLLAAEWGAHHNAAAAFYLLPTRAWELLVGALVALHLLHAGARPVARHPLAHEVLALAGLAMIACAVFMFDAGVPFPGFQALLPTVGTALLILFASPANLVGRVLGAGPLTGIGLISYGAYLWHQPLLAFTRHGSLVEPTAPMLAVMAMLAFPLAYLSWKYVEQPFRSGRGFSRKAILAFSVAGSLLFVAIGLAGTWTDGFPVRVSQGETAPVRIENRLLPNYGLGPACDGAITLLPECRTSDQPEILVWGDSYAMHLVGGILASNPDAGVIQMTRSACGPIFDIAPVFEPQYNVAWARECLASSQRVREWLQANDSVRFVVLSSPFSRYFPGSGGRLLLRSGEVVDPDASLVIRELEKTLAELKRMGITPVLVSPPPGNGTGLGQCLLRAEQQRRALDICDFPVTAISGSRQQVYQLLDRFDERYPVVRLERLICDESMCSTHIGDVFIFRDIGHLSREGAAALGRKHDFYRLITGRGQARRNP